MVAEQIQENQPGSHKVKKKIAAMFECTESSVSHIARKSLGLTPSKKVKVPNVSEKDKEKHLYKARNKILHTRSFCLRIVYAVLTLHK